MSSKKSTNRVWEIDFFRGFAIVLMIFDHLFFNLIYIYDIHIPLVSDSLAGFYGLLQLFFAGCFIFISGISSSFSRSNLIRGLKLLLIALLLTFVTYIVTLFEFADKSFIILFGVLHLLAVSMILASLLIKVNKYILILIGGVIIACIPLVNKINQIRPPNNYFAILGIYNNSFFSSDYFPIIPWLGIFIIGIAFGKIFYKEKKSLIKYDLKPNPFNYIGRYAIWVYLLHQPIILGILYLILG